MLDTSSSEKLIAELRAQVAALETMLYQHHDTYRVKLGLTPNEARVFAALINAGGYIPRRELALAMMGGHDQADLKSTLGVVVHRIRSKVKPLGIVIQTIWGGGFKLDVDKAKAVLEAL